MVNKYEAKNYFSVKLYVQNRGFIILLSQQLFRNLYLTKPSLIVLCAFYTRVYFCVEFHQNFKAEVSKMKKI